MIIASAFGLLVASLVVTRSRMHDDVKADWDRRSAALATEITATYERTLDSFQRVVLSLSGQPELQSMTPGLCEELFPPSLAGLPEDSKLAIVGLDGVPICMEPETDVDYDVSDLPYFGRALRTGEVTVSGFFYGPNSGLPLVTVSKSIDSPDGERLGLVVMGVNLVGLTETVFPDPDLTVVVFDDEGTLLTRLPTSDDTRPGTAVARELLEARTRGAAAVDTESDTGTTHFTLHSLRSEATDGSRDAHLAVGYDPTLVGDRVDRLVLLNLAATILVLGALFTGLWFLLESVFLRRLRWIVRASNNLGNGDLTARTSLEPRDDELGQLAQTFDRMADRLQESREREAAAAAERLAEKDRRLRQIMDHLDAAVWMWSPADRRILYLSAAFEEIWGIAVEEARRDPKLLIRTVHPEDRARIRAERRGGHMQEGESQYRIVRPDGEVRWILHRTSALRDAEGEVSRYLGTAMDITELKELEESLQKSQRLESLGLLAGGVAHDFNNILTVIRGHTQLLMDEMPEGGDERHPVTEIDAAAKRASKLTNQLLAFGRQQAYRPRSIDVNELIVDLMSMLRRLVNTTIEVEAELEEELPCVVADHSHLEQAIVNLVVNSRDAMPDGGIIRVRTRLVDVAREPVPGSEAFLPAEEYVSIEVSDDGVGMDEETIARAYEPFFTTKEPGKGTGLGLASTFGAVKQSGGYMWIESAPQEGTTVRIFFPPSSAADVVAPDPVRPAQKTPLREHFAGRVLLAEDEPAVRAVIRTILERAGYEVTEAADGREALEVFSGDVEGFDLLLTDIVMPEFTGTELCRRIREIRPDLPVVFMSGYAGEARSSEVLEIAAAAFVQKPFTWEALARTIQEVRSSGRSGTIA